MEVHRMSTKEKFLSGNSTPGLIPFATPAALAALAKLGLTEDETPFIREPDSMSRIDFEMSRLKTVKLPNGKTKREPDFSNLEAMLLVRALVDKDGKPIFALTDAPAVGKMSSAITRPLFDEARMAWHIGEDAEKKLLEDLEGNSTTPT
jgi:hypothetical protein